MNENPQMLLFSKAISVSYSFSVSIENHPCNRTKKKCITFLFIALIYFPLSIQMNILTLYNKFYVILATHMLDSDQEPSYNLSQKSFITA